MRNRLVFLWALVAVAGLLTMPGSVMATTGFDYGVIHDYCGGDMGWTTFYKAREISSGTTHANRLTIDSSAQEKYFTDPNPHWVTVHTWSRVSTSFAVDGTYHFLTLARKWNGGNIEQVARIVFKLRAWHNSTLLWSLKVHSTSC